MEIIHSKAKNPIASLLFAHGAGAPMDSEWMNNICQLLVDENIEVIRFNFPYMTRRKLENKKFPPDRKDKLLPFWHQLINKYSSHTPLFIGGKSMGGRMASLVLQESCATGLVAFGFPFHPPGKPEKTRLESFVGIKKPCLILQGDRDTLGSQQEIKTYSLPDCVSIKYLPDGDHSLKPRKKSGQTFEQNLNTAAQYTRSFIETHT